jgi:hypothetical protein
MYVILESPCAGSQSIKPLSPVLLTMALGYSRIYKN